MKKLILSILSTFLPISITCSSISCSISNYNESKIDDILNFRETKVDYKYMNNWQDLLLQNATTLAKYFKEFNNNVYAEARKWRKGNINSLKSQFQPLPQKNLDNDIYETKIFVDLEFPYKNSPETPVNGSLVAASTLGEEEFIQVYNYKYLKDKGYIFKVNITSEGSSSLDLPIRLVNENEPIDENGAIYFKGSDTEGSSYINIEAIKDNKTLNFKLNVNNYKNDNVYFLQWRTFVYLKYYLSEQYVMQSIAACYLVQIYAQMMYNACYNSQKDLTAKLPLLDSRMLNLLFCAKNFSMFLGYIEFWASVDDEELENTSYYFSFDFYVHPIFNSSNPNDTQVLFSNPVLRLSNKLLNFAIKSAEKYESLNRKEN